MNGTVTGVVLIVGALFALGLLLSYLAYRDFFEFREKDDYDA